ncbi:OsmC family protein [Dokdonella sp.]|uniref:OsmC family protein n=1 Tax=Dokdonella sp. TaxID=2291710 RepID=UPI001B2F39AD|nr:OsmC family protein [Dokdonella sp.]MBO9662643.1 OsmC family protein [Dokdonella sp.]
MSGTRFDAPPVATGTVVVAETGDGRFAQYVLDGRHQLAADEPASAGGDDTGPGPYELLLMALGACTSMTLRLYATRKQMPLERVIVRLRHAKRYIEDCRDCGDKPVMLDHIQREIELVGAREEDKPRLLDMADKCPVHRTLTSKIVIDTRLA